VLVNNMTLNYYVVVVSSQARIYLYVYVGRNHHYF